MRINYNILWFEDIKSSFNAKKQIVKEIVEEFGFTFPEPRNEINGDNIDSINYDEYDLIIVDLNLAGTKGSTLINKIRNNEGVYTEVIFYSSDGEKAVRDALKEYEVDGAYCAGRENDDFEKKVEKVIKTTIKKVQDLNNMRGLVMAEVSDLDNKMIEVIESYYAKAEEEKKSAIKDYISNKILKSYDCRAKQTKKVLEEEGFNDFINMPIFESMQKLISIKHFIKEIKSSEKIEAYKEILNDYNEEVIDVRNVLAHANKIEIKEDGTKVLKGKKEFEFSDDSCAKVRKDIKKHSTNFDDILNIINY